MLARTPFMGEDVSSILVNVHAPIFFPSNISLTNKLLGILKSEKLLNANLIHYSSDSDAYFVLDRSLSSTGKANTKGMEV